MVTAFSLLLGRKATNLHRRWNFRLVIELYCMGTTALTARGLPPETLDLARSGEEAALRRVYEAHASAILNRLYKLTGDEERAEELCQDTFSYAFEHLGDLRKDTSLGAWLHGIAFNLARAENDRKRRRRGLLERFRGRLQPNSAPPADAGLAWDDAIARLHRAMEPLTAGQREAYVLRVLEKLSLEECARLLQLPVSTVSYRARRAEQIVRANFEEDKS
jgi:RNA polymerase sigma-70 factor (ECF subfamily)